MIYTHYIKLVSKTLFKRKFIMNNTKISKVSWLESFVLKKKPSHEYLPHVKSRKTGQNTLGHSPILRPFDC